MIRQIGIDPEVGDHHARPEKARQHVDRRAAGKEVEDHLRRHLSRIRAHPLGRDTVVGGERKHDAMLEGWTELAAHTRQIDRKLLQPAEAAGGLGEAVLSLACLLPGILVDRWDVHQDCDATWRDV